MQAFVMLTNACSINNKWDELVATTSGADIVAITETWLTPGLRCTTLQPPAYADYRTDRPEGRVGGGALLLVSKKYETVEAVTLTTPNVQATACTLMVGVRRVAVVCVYRSPAATVEEGVQLREYLEELTTEERVLLMGDFNAPEVNWTTLTAPSGTFGETLVRLLEDKGLIQHITENTRFRQGQNPSTLDLVFTKTNQEVEEIEYGPPLGNSDHSTLSFKLRLRLPQPPHKYRRALRLINPQRLIANALEMDWVGEGGSKTSGV